MQPLHIFILIGGLLGLLVVVPLFKWLMESGRPTVREWKELSGRIRELSRSDLNNEDFSEATRDALRLVLTDRPGHANKNNLPFALQILEDSGLHAAASIRALSTVSVFIGLVVTAIVFAMVLGQLVLAMAPSGVNQTVPVIDPERFPEIFGQLKLVYETNGVAIAIALLVYVVSRTVEGNVHKVSRVALSVMGQLPDSVEADLDPKFVAAMRTLTDIVQEQLQSNISSWQEAQLEDIRGIVREVKDLARTVGTAIETLQQVSTGESTKVLAAIRETQVSVAESAVRMENGLGLIVQEAAPAIDRFSKAATELSETTDRLRTSGTLESVAAVRSGLQELRSAVSALPESLDQAFRSTASELRVTSEARFDAAGRSIVQSMNDAAEHIDTNIRNAVASIPEGVSAATAAALSQQAADQKRVVDALVSATAALDSNARILSSCVKSIDDTQRKIQEVVERAGGRRGIFR